MKRMLLAALVAVSPSVIFISVHMLAENLCVALLVAFVLSP